MQPIQVSSVVGPDGVLSLRIPLGEQRANASVVVTIADLPEFQHSRRPVLVQDWHRFVQETYGSCADLGLEEPL